MRAKQLPMTVILLPERGYLPEPLAQDQVREESSCRSSYDDDQMQASNSQLQFFVFVFVLVFV